jgi:hypothetical protein
MDSRLVFNSRSVLCSGPAVRLLAGVQQGFSQCPTLSPETAKHGPLKSCCDANLVDLAVAIADTADDDGMRGNELVGLAVRMQAAAGLDGDNWPFAYPYQSLTPSPG